MVRRFLFIAAVIWYAISYIRSVRRIRLRFSGDCADVRRQLVERICERCPGLTSYYYPTLYALYPMMGFALLTLKEIRARFLTSSPYTRDHLLLRDGGRIALDWVEAQQPLERPVVCILLHGLFQSSVSVTMSDLAKDLAREGNIACVMNRRGYELPLETSLGDQIGDLRKVMSIFGDDEDLDDVLQHIHQRFPESKIAIVGFSAGTAQSARYPCKRPELSAWSSSASNPCILCSVCLDPGYVTDAETGCIGDIRFPYSLAINWTIKYQYFLKQWRTLVKSPRHKQALYEALSPRSDTKRTLRATISLTDFESEDTYNTSQEPSTRIHQCTVPLLAVNSRDDPICGWHMIDRLQSILGGKPTPFTVIADMERGGHGCKFDMWGLHNVGHNLVCEFIAAANKELVEHSKHI